jgi:methylated-DNA-[protein]-cysteine S-methyltransferase
MKTQIETWFDELPRSPIGALSVVVTRAGVRQVVFGKSLDLPLDMAEGNPPSALYHAIRQLREFLAGERRVFDLPLDLDGLTDFQKKVLAACQEIPYGQTLTYADLAQKVGAPLSASRAVGMVMATNPLPLIIPCHRVVGRDGKLHGYAGAGGVETKAWLLRLEGARLVG